MSASFVTTLNPVQKAQIQSLSTSFPVEEVDFFAYVEIDGIIRSAAAFLEEDETTYECFAYTDPEYRSQGLFSELLDLAINELPEDTAFIFYTNGKDADCMAALHALEADLVLEEHMMEIDLAVFIADSASDLPLTVSETEVDGTTTWQYQNPHGVVNISVYSSYYYLYGFEIKEELRGLGHGKTFLFQVLGDLTNRRPIPLRLQVSGGNIPALSLYKKTGFQITETLFGYLY